MSDWIAFIGAWRSTQAANAQAEGQAYEAKMNAEIMNQNAALEAKRRDQELRDNRRKYNLLTGQSRAQAGALGIFGGSALDVLADISNQGVFEQQSIVTERVGAQQNYLNQAASYKARAQNLLASRQSPWINASLAWAQEAAQMATSVATGGLGGGGGLGGTGTSAGGIGGGAP